MRMTISDKSIVSIDLAYTKVSSLVYPSATGCPTLPCPSEEDDDDDRLPAPIIVLIVFACLLFLLIAVVLAICLKRWYDKKVEARRAKQQRLNEYMISEFGNIYRNGNNNRTKENQNKFPVLADNDVTRFVDGSDIGSDDVFEHSDIDRPQGTARRGQHKKGMFYITSDDSDDGLERKRAVNMETFSSPANSDNTATTARAVGQEGGRPSLLTLAKLATRSKPTRAKPDPVEPLEMSTLHSDVNSWSYHANPSNRQKQLSRELPNSRPSRTQSLDDHIIFSDDSVDRMYPASPALGGLHHWRAMGDLSRPLSSSEPSISHRSSFSGASPEISRYQPRFNRDPYPPKPARSTMPKQVPQKPKRQKKQPAREPSFMNRIVPPPSLYSSMDNGIVYMPEPDYDISDDSALIPLAGNNAIVLRGVDNPIFIPDPDYPLYAGYESFDEINGSLV